MTSSPGRLAALTNDGLVGFRRAGGVQGAGLVPNLATSLPTPTDGGLTYTFQLRNGVRYSTGAPVLAGDIRRGIERAVVHPERSPGYYTAAIVGAQTCADAAQKAIDAKRPRPDCDLTKGVVTDDRTGIVTFHLTKPTSEFLYQLALPNASAVPQDTPVDLPPGATLPATGPYVVRSYTPRRPGKHGRLELVRNPRFRIWSPAAQPAGYPDRIVLETGYTEKQALARVTGGLDDLLWDGAPKEDAEALRTRYGSQLHTSPGQVTRYVFLNTSKPPFNNHDARRALAYALDRGALVSLPNQAGPVTCQIIPPGFTAYQPYCPYTLGGGGDGKWAGPDLASAQDLVRRSGTRGARVILVTDDDSRRAAASLVVALLNRLGYRASLRVLPYPAFADVTFDLTADWNGVVQGWVADYPAASVYLAKLASCDPELQPFNPTGYCDSEIETQIAAALEMQTTDPARASEAWAAIDHAVVDAAAYIPYGNNLRQDFVSSRVGNVLVHPVTGPLIAQMWVQ